MIFRIFIIILLFSESLLLSESDLMQDLMIVDYWDRKLAERMPVHFNHLLYGGYINMPSARMSEEGELGIGFANVPPYLLYSLRCQLNPRLEISGNYRIFRGIDDPILSPFGFGDLSDKGANIKLSLFKPEDSQYRLPGVAMGFEDFMGTRSFKAYYLVATKVFLPQSFELTLGYGGDRIGGLFGGALWMPFRQDCSWLSSLTLLTEFDHTRYKNPLFEKHPRGREQKTPFNFGVQYKLFDAIDLSLSYVRGCKWAFAISSSYNFGYTKGFLPKLEDPLLYQSPVITEPLDAGMREEDLFALELACPFREQGFQLLEVSIGYDECLQKRLYVHVYNPNYRLESVVRERITYLLAHLLPCDVRSVVAVIESEGFPVHEYLFYQEYLQAFRIGQIGYYELSVLSPMQNVTFVDPLCKKVIYEQKRNLWNLDIRPRSHTFFGSSKGKFKFALGLNVGIDGYIFDDIYYNILVGHNFWSDLHDVKDVDRLNPSQLINVRTDIVNYYTNPGLALDQAYLQKNWNLGRSYFAKLAVGYFEEEYAGLASELLYYPLECPWAIGIEGALFKKRDYRGLGFTNKVRKLNGFVPTWKNFYVGSQIFVNAHYHWKQAQLDLKVSAGKFLANDVGVRFEVSRYFPSGMEIYIWYTLTNGNDHINGQLYHDKGAGISIPLDIFFCRSSRQRWCYEMSAWLRDVGVRAKNGLDLYDLIREERQDF